MKPTSMQCTHCKEADVEYVDAESHLEVTHWQCPVCDSTYDLGCYDEEDNETH